MCDYDIKLTEKEIKAIGQNRWMNKKLWPIIFQAVVVALISTALMVLGEVIENTALKLTFYGLGYAVMIPWIILLLYRVDKAGKEFKNFTKGKLVIRADFLWPHDEGSIEEAGYEFANARTEEYREECWHTLVKSIKSDKRLC